MTLMQYYVTLGLNRYHVMTTYQTIGWQRSIDILVNTIATSVWVSMDRYLWIFR